MLTREEVERRLKRWSGVKPDDPSYLRDSGQREALQTALAAMDERDEAIQRGVSSAVALGKCQGERDALAAEGRLLREVVQEMVDCQHCIPDPLYSVPLIAAEVARVKRLEAVLEAAEAQDPPASANLARALAAYRESERPGGEVCHEKITAREKARGK